MKILFIDDVPEFYEIVEILLEERGHAVTVVTNADEAIRLLPSVRKYDLVILDLMMRLGTTIPPGEVKETGIGIYNRLRALDRDTNVLVLTALEKSDVWQVFKDDMHTRYFPKPLYADKTAFFESVEVWP